MTQTTLNSFNANYLIFLQEYLKSELPQIAWIDQDMQQDADPTRPPLAYPALLVDFASTDFSNESAPGVFAVTTISMRLIDTPASQSYADAPLSVRTDALGLYELEHRLISALHGWTPDDGFAQPLSILSSVSGRADSKLRIRVLTFATAYEML